MILNRRDALTLSISAYLAVLASSVNAQYISDRSGYRFLKKPLPAFQNTRPFQIPTKGATGFALESQLDTRNNLPELIVL